MCVCISNYSYRNVRAYTPWANTRAFSSSQVHSAMMIRMRFHFHRFKQSHKPIRMQVSVVYSL